MVSAVDAEGIAAMDVTEAGVAVGGDDAEGDQRFWAIGGDLESGFHAFLECRDRLDDVIGGDDGADGIRIAVLQHGGGKADGVGGVAAHRFAQQIFLGQLGKILQHSLGVIGAGADENLFRRKQAAEAIVAELEKTLSVHDGEKLFWQVDP